jgi:hypothetical protein
MGQCNAQTDARPSGVVPTRVGQSTAQVPTTTKNQPLLQPTVRGLELIKSCAQFYANGVGVAKPAIQLSYPVSAGLNQPATKQTFPSRISKPSISTVAVMCSFFLVLPSLALAAIMWWGAISGAAGGPEVVAGDASAISTQSANPGIPLPRSPKAVAAAQTVSNVQSDIIIRKVKTQPIHGVDLGPTGSR